VNAKLPLAAAATRRALLCAAVFVLAASAVGAFTFESVVPGRDEAGVLWVTVRLDDPLEKHVEDSMGRGMPATLVLHTELWRHRTAWFDRLERAEDATVRLRYDVWQDAWRLERPGAAPAEFKSLDSLESVLSRPIQLPVANISKLPPDARCYVAITATVKPLKVEDVEEVEGWLTGEVQEHRETGITQLPRSVFDAVRNFAGFGDSHTRAITNDFSARTLPVVKR
jgi:hypothetical protein